MDDNQIKEENGFDFETEKIETETSIKETKLWAKITGYAQKAGIKVI